MRWIFFGGGVARGVGEIIGIRIRHNAESKNLSQFKAELCSLRQLKAVLWIRIRMDPELLPGSGSGIFVPDPDPAKHGRADK